MTMLDVLYLALIASCLLFEPLVLWPAFVRRSQVDAARARRFLWSSWCGQLWALVIPGVLLWELDGRPWQALRITAPHGWRLWLATAVVAAAAIWYARKIAFIARSQRRRRVRIGNPGVEKLAPHTSSELRLWMALSVTAGCCEEFLFRGYLIWAFQPLLGLWAAAALSIVVFAAAHAYQGAKGVAAVSVIGTVLTVVVLACGSLWPAMVMHTVVDAGEGLAAWLVLRKGRRCSSTCEAICRSRLQTSLSIEASEPILGDPLTDLSGPLTNDQVRRFDPLTGISVVTQW